MSCLSTISKTSNPPNEQVLQWDKLSSYKASFTVKIFEKLDDSLLELLDSDCKCSLFDKCNVYYKAVIKKLSIPQITERICIVFDLHVNQFYKASPKTFPDRFRKFRSKDMLPNSPTHIRIESEQWGDALDKL